MTKARIQLSAIIFACSLGAIWLYVRAVDRFAFPIDWRLALTIAAGVALAPWAVRILLSPIYVLGWIADGDEPSGKHDANGYIIWRNPRANLAASVVIAAFAGLMIWAVIDSANEKRPRTIRETYVGTTLAPDPTP